MQSEQGVETERLVKGPADWAVATIGTLVQMGAIKVHKDGNHGSQYPRVDEFGASGVPFLTAKLLVDGRIDLDAAPRLADERADKLRLGFVQPGDVLLSHNATVGRVAVVPKFAGRLLIGTSLTSFRLNESKILPGYLAAYFSGHDFQNQLKAVMSQTTRNQVPITSQRHLRIVVPPIPVQRAIASTLGTLDDRIDLLCQTNATLESIAQALFKSWFIDFDPICAKAEGREPEGMDAATAALFPAEFEESALGMIPKGWAVSSLSKHVIAERGLSYKGAGLCTALEGLPMHNLNSVLEGGDYKYAGIKFYKGEYKDRHVACAGDIIVANTEQGHDHRLIGYPALVPARFTKAIYSHHLYRVRRLPGSALTQHTLYYMLMTPSVREQIIGCANGSTVNMLKVAGLEIPGFVCPPPAIASAFEDAVAPLRARRESNVAHAESLAELRDTLLPRLISGKLRLPEVEKQLEEAAA
jgi:type I restriction enzyme S subunit